MNTGDKLKQLRIDKQLSMDALTDKLNSKFGLNITKSMMSRWENNLSEPSSKFVAAYARYFNVDLNYLVGLTDDKKPLNSTENNPEPEIPEVDTSVLTPEELAEFNKVTQTNQLLFFNDIGDDDHDMAVFKNVVIDILLKQRKKKEEE